MRKRFRMFFKLRELILTVIILACAIFVNILGCKRAAEDLNVLVILIFLDILCIFGIIFEGKCFHFMKITDQHFIFSICGIRVAKLEINKTSICFGEVTHIYFSWGAFIFSESVCKKFCVRDNVIGRNLVLHLCHRKKENEKYYYCIFTPSLMKALEKTYKKPIDISQNPLPTVSKKFFKQKQVVEKYNERIFLKSN